MAYETGTASGVLDLLDKLRIFATANGWTQNYFGARTTGAGQALQITKAGLAFTFIADTSTGSGFDPGHYFGCYAHNAYSAGNGTENQAQGSLKCFANGMTGPYVQYHFNTGAERGSDYLYVTVEVTSGIYKHCGVGKLVGFGALSTGAFAFACRWDYSSSTNTIGTPTATSHSWPFDYGESSVRLGPGTQIRADIDAISPRWYDMYNSASFGYGLQGGVRQPGGSTPGSPRGMLALVAAANASDVTGRNIVMPCWVAGERSSNFSSPLGYPPNMRWASLKFRSPGDILTIGTDQWKVFPVIRKDGGIGQPNSGKFAYAFKVN